MNRIDLTNIGGFPLEQDTLKFMQDGNADMFNSLAALLGDKTIVSGVQVVGGNVTSGWIVYQGEIIKFVGAAAGPNVIIVETTTDAKFEDGVNRPVYKTRYATIGEPAAFPFTDLKPANVGVPAGTVVMWSGSVAAIPAGWQLHAPLAGKFIVGYDPADADYNAIGKMGGAKTHTLTEAEMPAHGHTISTTSSGTSGNDVGDPVRGTVVGSVNGRGQKGAGKTIGQTGGSQAFDIRPTFYTLAYIIKL